MAMQSPSSFVVTNTWPYDVFLSFRGEDTRFGFTNNLHRALGRNGIRSAIDFETLQVGKKISQDIEKAIEGSRIGIVIFSKNYASSSFCLEELVHILKCIKGEDRWVLPIFYKVDPCIVRHQVKSYKESFDKLVTKFNSDKIKRCKEALYKAANLKGEHFTGNEYEFDFIGGIVRQVSKMINRQVLDLSMSYLVGLESRVQNVMSLLDGESNEVKCMAGICGIGGIGKSTVARGVFNLIGNQFEGLCFLPNIRENSIHDKGLVELQRSLLFEILDGENIMFIDVYRGSGIIKDRLQQKKVLLVLDDIDQLKQLKGLAQGLDWFGPGSKIIITTRDKHLLHSHGVERIYEVETLNDTEAHELFCWNAFRKKQVDSCHGNISMRAIHYCKGLPLALNTIGCNLFNKEIEECESALDEFEGSPNRDIQKILKISYDGLESNEKLIFLDIACFLKGYKLSDVKDILQCRRQYFKPEYAISVLVEKSLISLHYTDNCIVNMHDLIQEMGKEIVRQESESKPSEWSRLWCYKDILDVLQEKKGTDKIEFIMLDMPEDEEVEWDGEAFKDMNNLKGLIIKNARFSKAPKHLPNSLRILEWKGYPSSSLPQGFIPKNLVMLDLPNCELTMDKPFQKFKFLTYMNLSNNRFIRQVPDMTGLPNLEKLNLQGCKNLIEVHDSIGQHDKMRELYAAGCSKLRVFPHCLKSRKLSHLDLSGCLTLPSFPKFVAEKGLFVSVYGDPFHSSLQMEVKGLLNDYRLYTGTSMFSKLDRLISASEGSSKVRSLTVQLKGHWIDEVFLHTHLSWFSTLEELNLNCNKLTGEFLFTRLQWFPNLTVLDLSANDIAIIPACINQCHFLRTLYLDECYQLREIRGIPSSIKTLSAMGCKSLISQSLDLLLCEKLHECGGTDFQLPGSSIPTWFDHRCKGSSLSFWFRKKFPLAALCLIQWGNALKLFSRVTVKVLVNRHKIASEYLHNFGDRFAEHVYLFDLQHKFKSLWSDDEAVKEHIEDGWNHVEFKLKGSETNIEWMGVYVYKQNHDAKDITFTDPTTVNRKKRRVPPRKQVNIRRLKS